MSNTSLQPLTLHPWVYVLRCQPRAGTDYPTLYVGVTLNAHQRITQHFTGSGHANTRHRSRVGVCGQDCRLADTEAVNSLGVTTGSNPSSSMIEPNRPP